MGLDISLLMILALIVTVSFPVLVSPVFYWVYRKDGKMGYDAWLRNWLKKW